MIKLDFTLETAEERKDYANTYLENIKGEQLSSSDLETIANYILYGKDKVTGKSVVDEKKVQIKTKYKSFSKKDPESLDELLENPSFDEGTFLSKKNHFKSIKPKIDREKDGDIPGIRELWTTIDHIQRIIDKNSGKIDDPSLPTLTPLELYKYKHMVIELRRQQFYLRDSAKPTICMFGITARKGKTYEEVEEDLPWDLEGSNFAIAPLGVLINGDKKFLNPREYRGNPYSLNENASFTIDFRNSEHIYYLLENYEDLRIWSMDKPESTIGYLLDTLDFYIERAELPEAKKVILESKKRKVKNERIRERLKEEFGLNHSANYISTIWKKKICGDIAAAAQLHYDYYLKREDPFAWKVCNQCGQAKLKDTREFMRKSRSSDGLSNRCKKCDKENRQKA